MHNYVSRFLDFKRKHCDPYQFDERVILESSLKGLLQHVQFHVRLSNPLTLEDAYERAKVVDLAFQATALSVRQQEVYKAKCHARVASMSSKEALHSCGSSFTPL